MTDLEQRAMEAKRLFIDTEFIESGPNHPLILLSIGIVAEDGREFYWENEDADLSLANDWVRKNVLPHLTGKKLPFRNIGANVLRFVNNVKGVNPEFWGYYADYDWVVFCQLFGTMIDLPKGWPMYCRDIKQLCDSLGNPKLPEQDSTEHNALNDARWNKKAWTFLDAFAESIRREAWEQGRDAVLSKLPETVATDLLCNKAGNVSLTYDSAHKEKL